MLRQFVYYHVDKRFYRVLQGFMSGVQSICHPFATVIFKIITEQRKGSEHAEQSADSLPIFLFMTFLLV